MFRCTLPPDAVRRLAAGSLTVLLTILSGCGGGAGGTGSQQSAERVLTGPTSFVSANAPGAAGGDANILTYAAVPQTVATAATATTRTAVEGDIYRILDNGKTILNLNRSRGLQIIDIGDSAKPAIIGRVPMSADPVEMYRVDDRVCVLLNNWSEYRRLSKGGKEVLDHYNGGAVLTVDIANRAAPKIISTVHVPGYLQASRLTIGAGKAALYVAAINYNDPATGFGQNSVQSFSVDGQGQLVAVASLPLGGYVGAVQANGDRLMVAHNNVAQGSYQTNQVMVVDISRADGVMVAGADITVSGIVQQKNNMNVQGDILRVVSGTNWGSLTQGNSVETFNIADLAHPKAVDRHSFGDGQQLFATTFLPDRAFFVTYLRTDPFHAFSIAADGMMKEESSFVVSGWNDFFSPVANQSRLIGIGHDDANHATSLAVSLYDISNLQNTKPLLMRASLDLASAWSEGNWDDRGFSVLENAVSTVATDGKTVETGLVLLPFSGWDQASQAYRSGVQLFTFSSSSVTRRGVMNQASQVRRSTLTDSASQIAANLSDSELSLFKVQNTDAPQAAGSLMLAPDFNQFIAFANVGVRYKANDNNWWGSNATRFDSVELVPLSNADGGVTLSSISVPSGAKLYNVGEHLIVVSTDTTASVLKTTIASYDVSNGDQPLLLGTLVTDQLVQVPNIYLAASALCVVGVPDCGRRGSIPPARVVGNALVFNSIGFQAPPPASIAAQSYYANYTFQIVDLGAPAAPKLLPKITMASDEQAVNLVTNGKQLWVNYKKDAPSAVKDQPQVRYYVKLLDLSTPASAVLGNEINIPGQLMSVAGDTLYSFDYHWNATDIDTSLNVSILQNNLAYLQATLPLKGQNLSGMIVDGSKLVVVNYDYASNATRLSFFTVGSNAITLASSMALDSYPTLKYANAGKLLVQTYEGLLVFDFNQPAMPTAQAFFPAISWNGDVALRNGQLYVAAGTYGIYQFTLESANLAAP
jgi:hypothetical protein